MPAARPAVDRFWERVEIIPFHNCWEWIGRKNPTGYGAFDVIGGESRAHRFSWAMMHGPIPDDLCVLHRCDNRGCVRPDHLFLGTQIENIKDMDLKKRRKILKGETHGTAILTEKQVLEIRKKYIPHKYGLKKIAIEFLVCTSTVHNIVKKLTWFHI